MNKIIKTTIVGFVAVAGLFVSTGIASAQISESCTTATLTGTVTPNGVATTVWFEMGLNESAVSTGGGFHTASQVVPASQGSVPVTQYISNLTPSTTYYYRAVVSNTVGSATGVVRSFSTPSCVVTPPPPTGSAPTVTTSGATNVSTNSATLNGYVNSSNASTNAWFEWGTNSSFGYSIGQNNYGTTSGTNYSTSLSGLAPNTTYYYRAMASNSYGAATPGQTQTFTTNSVYVPPYVPPTGSQPSVNTLSAGAVTTSSATLNGYVNGNGAYTTTWFEWGTNTSYGYTASSNANTSGSTNFSGYINGLNQNTVYYYRAVAQNSYGIRYGDPMSFTTTYAYFDPCPSCNNNNNGSQPSITTTSATNLNTSSATLNGYVNGNGNYTTAWFEWGTNSNYGYTTSSNSVGTGYTNFSMPIFNLNSNATYYYRAVARNSYGTVYGNQMSFTTNLGYSNWNPAPVGNISTPSAVTSLATDVTDTSAQLNSLVFTSNSVSSNAWFEWGTSSSLGYKTNTVSVGNLPSIRHAANINGLVRGVTYYYRVVAENSYGRSNGQTLSFVAQTTSTPSSNIVVINRPVTTPTTTVVNYGTGVESLIKLDVNGGTDVIAAGERRTYDITWKNDSKLALNKVALRVILPEQLTFVSGSRGSFSSADNTLTVDIRALAPGETGNVVIVADAKSTIKNGELVVVVANLAYTTPAGVQGIADAYATQTGVVGTTAANNLGASIFGAGTFLPTTLFGWLLLLILTLLLVLIGNHLYGRMAAAPKH